MTNPATDQKHFFRFSSSFLPPSLSRPPILFHAENKMFRFFRALDQCSRHRHVFSSLSFSGRRSAARRVSKEAPRFVSKEVSPGSKKQTEQVIYQATSAEEYKILAPVALCWANIFATSMIIKQILYDELKAELPDFAKRLFLVGRRHNLAEKALGRKIFACSLIGSVGFASVIGGTLYGARFIRKLSLLPSGLLRVEVYLPLRPFRRKQRYVDYTPFQLMQKGDYSTKRRGKAFLKLPNRRLWFMMDAARLKNRHLLKQIPQSVQKVWIHTHTPCWTSSFYYNYDLFIQLFCTFITSVQNKQNTETHTHTHQWRWTETHSLLIHKTSPTDNRTQLSHEWLEC